MQSEGAATTYTDFLYWMEHRQSRHDLLGNYPMKSPISSSLSTSSPSTSSSTYHEDGDDDSSRGCGSQRSQQSAAGDDHGRRLRQRKAIVLLTFAGLLALILLLFYDVNARVMRGSTEAWGNPRLAQLHIPSIGSLLYGRRLLPRDDGDYFTRIHYTQPVLRFYQPHLADIPRGESYAILNDMLGCPNGYAHTDALRTRVFAGEHVCNTLNIYRCTAAMKTTATSAAAINASKQTVAYERLAPVLVYVHEGGWFSRSNSNLHPPSAIRNLACRGGEGTVIVSLNYRIGPYGHINAHQAQYNDDRSRGYTEEGRNFAMQDIRMGLRWVQKNAHHFGGNASQVTVMARGRGAQLASLLSYQEASSNRSDLLIHQLVLLGGSSYTPTLYEYEIGDGEPSSASGGNQSERNGGMLPFPLHNHYDSSMEFALAANCTQSEHDWLLAMWNLMGQEEGLRESNAIYKCLQQLSREAIEEVEAKRPYGETFIRWPIVVGGRSPQHTLRPPFDGPEDRDPSMGRKKRKKRGRKTRDGEVVIAAPAHHPTSSPIPTMIGICRRGTSTPTFSKSHDRHPAAAAGTKNLPVDTVPNEAALRRALDVVRDLKNLPYANRIVDYYVGAFREGWLPAHFPTTSSSSRTQVNSSGDDAAVVGELMESIRHDITSDGPVMLEAYRRGVDRHRRNRYYKGNGETKPGGEDGTYLFHYEAPHELNRSQIDIASTGEEKAFEHVVDRSVQLPCIDDLLFNPLDNSFHGISRGSPMDILLRKQAKLVDIFADYLVNFIHRGDPNALREEPSNRVKKPRPTVWPKVAPGESSPSTLGMAVLRLRGDEGHASRDYLPMLYSEEHLRFWLCEMASNMNMPPHPRCTTTRW